MLLAGEASGDLHGSELIRALKGEDSEAQFAFLGGDLMASAAGRPPVIHYKEMAYMGFAEVMRHLPQVGRNLRVATELLKKIKPDALILIDYPSFNLRVAAEAAKLGVPVYYYISPKVWAWKEYRTAKIAAICRRVLAILPFEPEFYRSHGYEACTYVGNPSVEEIDGRLAGLTPEAITRFREENALGEKPVIALVPGSRVNEIRRNLPLMVEAIKTLAAKYQAVIAGAPGISPGEYGEAAGGIPVVFDGTTTLMRAATAAVVTSGTASLEAALAGVPQVVCYRHSGSRAFYAVMSRVLKIPFVSLPNLIAGREVVPELLLHHCTPHNILKNLLRILPGREGRDEQLSGYELVRQRLGSTHAAATAARLICSDLS